MTSDQFKQELFALLNRARLTVNAQELAEPLIDSAATIVVLADHGGKGNVPLEGMVELLRHRLDESVGAARITYGL